MVSLQVRMTAAERDAIRVLAEAEGLALRELLAAMVLQWQPAPAAMPAAMTPELVERVDALATGAALHLGAFADLEARVLVLEQGQAAGGVKPSRRKSDKPKAPAVAVPMLAGLPDMPAELVQILTGAGLPLAWPTTGNEGMAFVWALRDAGITIKAQGATIGLTTGAMRSGISYYKDRPMTDEWRLRIATAGVRVVDPGGAGAP